MAIEVREMILAVVVAGVLGSLLDRVWMSFRHQKLLVVSEADLRSSAPVGIAVEDWLATHLLLSRWLKIPPEYLDPWTTLARLETHYSLLGMSSVDVESLLEDRLEVGANFERRYHVTVFDVMVEMCRKRRARDS